MDFYSMFPYFLTAAVLTAMIIRMTPVSKGRRGERRVSRILHRLNPGCYKVMDDVMLRRPDGRTAQIDHVVICLAGIYAIETKNYRGMITGERNRKQWTLGCGSHARKFMNPLHQNYSHVKALEELLETAGEKIRVKSIVTFPRRDQVIPLDMPEVVAARDLRKKIENDFDMVPFEKSIDEIADIISAANISTPKMHREHRRRIRRSRRDDLRNIRRGVCPRCGMKMERYRFDGKRQWHCPNDDCKFDTCYVL